MLTNIDKFSYSIQYVYIKILFGETNMKKIITVLVLSAILTGCCGCHHHKGGKHHKHHDHVTSKMHKEHGGK